ncbi:RCC1 domain-containing protein [Corallococcus carmarthensis]|uniref:PKD domain-containing protein n=1 Tax=Corallococcus carmarthensis TaxID=2316728 RepID=A0A3A8K0N1_9BACT|nr:PKD domain-containing protein [Corallococcus carmarthensis]RKH01016.1 PKD domain-containing protein [Corallococcus carmarthensis]
MRSESRCGLAVLAMGLVLALAGCGEQQVLEGSAQAVVTLPQALSASDIARVELTVSGAGMTTRTDALVKTGGQWGGVLGQLPAGTGRTFSARAFDASNTVRYAGQVMGVAIQAGLTTAVTLLLQEVNAPPPFDNAAPRILSLVASPGTVAPGGQVALQATADDPNAGDSLTYAWTAPSGSFSTASSLSTTWTAPTAAGQVVLTLTVTDSKGAIAALGVTLTVSTGNGSAAVNVSFNTWPQVTKLTALPSSVAVGQSTQVTASASDSDGDSLSFEWTASCAGTWTNTTSATASFTPSAQPSGGTCTLSVAARDGRGGQGIGSLTLYVGVPTTGQFPPEIVETFHSIATVPAQGDTVVFRARARDPQGSALSFAWTANAAGLGTASNSPTFSEVLWSAGACLTSGTSLTVTVTVTNALGLSASASMVLAGGTPCTSSPRRVAWIAAGGAHSLVVRQDGTAVAWGNNAYGQLGDGTNADRLIPVPVPVQDLTGATALSATAYHTLALQQDGTVWGWGYNDSGQLGDALDVVRVTPAQLPGLTGITALASGTYHSLALQQDGTVWAWGLNNLGQLGDGTTVSRPERMPVPGLTGVTALAASTYHSLALKQDGTVWTWGYNSSGQLGDGTTTSHLTPVQVQGLMGVSAIAAGLVHSLALKQDGTVWTWGRNTDGQLGNGATVNSPVPVRVQGLTAVTAMAAGAYHTLALKQDGSAWTWGRNDAGQLGDGTVAGSLTPVQVQNLTAVTALAGGDAHSMALLRDGTVWTWGYNGEGELGDGTTTDRAAPVRVQGLDD